MIVLTQFTISRGNISNLPSQLMDGAAYFCVDTGELYIDYIDESGILYRKQINANKSKELIGYDIATNLNAVNIEIPTSKAVMDKISFYETKEDAQLKHDNVVARIGANESAIASFSEVTKEDIHALFI